MLVTTYIEMLNSNKQTNPVSTKKGLVLIVDDDRGMRQILRFLVEKEGFQVIEAVNGEEALLFYKHYSPDLVLLDAMMPVMDGFTCCYQLCNSEQSFPVPVLMVTNLNDNASIVRAFEAGAVDYVTKPINRAILQQRVQRLIEQHRLMQQVRQMNDTLDNYAQKLNVAIRERTTELERSLEFESALKHITDRVRDSLNEGTVLQTVVQELCWALELGCCNAAIYDLENRLTHVKYEYTASIGGYQNRTIHMDSSLEIYQQLLRGESVQFCSLAAHSDRGKVSLFAFPLKDEEVIGDIWLISYADRVLNDLEIRLVKQVINQCVIAIRQARLYETAQAQVKELQCLNQLKDDFLSTVSHELRTPLTNMLMAIQLLERFMSQNLMLSQESSELSDNVNKCNSYLQILHSECDREINLVNDLLDLQRFEAKEQRINIISLNFQDWLSQEIEGFMLRVQSHRQTFEVNVADSLPLVRIDPLSLQRILTELINNACKYSPPEASIILIATKKEAFPPTICLSVINTGVTISPDEFERVFDKFYRIPNGDPWNKGGTGLGLALIKRLVKLFGGSIWVTSEANETCFTVELPAE
ncbi:MAG TPA: response regulator [Leptolyngbyaceae cyanobacterium]